MHRLYTTDSFIVSKIPHGESNLVYRLFTRELGLLYAHGQGVRELRNRNRYALRTGERARVTLVRGRETWRITGAQHAPVCPEGRTPLSGAVSRKVIALAGRLLPVEDPAPELFTILEQGIEAAERYPTLLSTVETVTVLRLLRERGYVPDMPLLGEEGLSFSTLRDLSEQVLTRARRDKKTLVRMVNSALEEAKI